MAMICCTDGTANLFPAFKFPCTSVFVVERKHLIFYNKASIISMFCTRVSKSSNFLLLAMFFVYMVRSAMTNFHGGNDQGHGAADHLTQAGFCFALPGFARNTFKFLTNTVCFFRPCFS